MSTINLFDTNYNYAIKIHKNDIQETLKLFTSNANYYLSKETAKKYLTKIKDVLNVFEERQVNEIWFYIKNTSHYISDKFGWDNTRINPFKQYYSTKYKELNLNKFKRKEKLKNL